MWTFTSSSMISQWAYIQSFDHETHWQPFFPIHKRQDQDCTQWLPHHLELLVLPSNQHKFNVFRSLFILVHPWGSTMQVGLRSFCSWAALSTQYSDRAQHIGDPIIGERAVGVSGAAPFFNPDLIAVRLVGSQVFVGRWWWTRYCTGTFLADHVYSLPHQKQLSPRTPWQTARPQEMTFMVVHQGTHKQVAFCRLAWTNN